MKRIGGLKPTGRKLLGPASDLVELEGKDGLRHTAIVFHPEFQGHRAINEAIDVVASLLESPMVVGLVDLVGRDKESGAFIYPTGHCWSVSEIISSLADLGKSAGVRAGLEIMYAAGQILIEASEIGQAEGVYSHGGLTPLRVLLKHDGQVQVIGHALPQVDILQFHDDNTQVPREDSFRYCPPERLEGEPENLSSDLFALTLVAFELMTGKPVYDGLVNDIRQQAARAEGSRRLFRFREVLPQSVRDLLGTALRPAPDARHASGEGFLEEVREVLSSQDAEGPSLIDVMELVTSQIPRHGAALQGGKTAALSQDDLERILAGGTDAKAVGESGDRGAKGRTVDQLWRSGSDRKRRPPPRKPRRRQGEGSKSRSKRKKPKTSSKNPPPPQVPAPTLKSSEGEGAKWGPAVRKRRAPVRIRGDEDTETLAKSGDKADDLLAQIRTSLNERNKKPEKRPDADEVIEAILGNCEETTKTECTSDPDTDVPEIEPTVKRKKSKPPAPETLFLDVEEDPEDKTIPLKKPRGRKKRDEKPKEQEKATKVSPQDALAFIAGGTSRGETKTFRFRAEASPRPVKVRIPTQASPAEAVTWLLGKVIPVQLDLRGSLTGWYRLELDGKQLPIESTMADVDSRKNLYVRIVRNSIINADIEVIQEDRPLRFRAPVGTAVPISTLIDHLTRWLGLAPGPWQLSIDDRLAGPHDILMDHTISESPRLRLQPAAHLEGT